MRRNRFTILRTSDSSRRAEDVHVGNGVAGSLRRLVGLGFDRIRAADPSVGTGAKRNAMKVVSLLRERSVLQQTRAIQPQRELAARSVGVDAERLPLARRVRREVRSS